MDKYTQIAQDVFPKYVNLKGLAGIIWIGSSTFGIEDPDVDVDIRLVIKEDEKSQPMEQFRVDGVKVEVDEMSYKWLTNNTEPDSDQYWIREKAIILYDPGQALKNKFNSLHSEIRKNHIQDLWRVFKELFGDYEIEKCLRRKQYEAGTMILYQGIQALLKFIFVYHGQPVPPLKWRWYFLYQGHLIDKDFKNNLSRLILSDLDLTEKLAIFKQAEALTQQLMIKAGYNPEQVKEYWRF